MSNIKRWYKLTNKTFRFGKKEQEQGILGTREQGDFGNKGTRGFWEQGNKGILGTREQGDFGNKGTRGF
jgi:hypothetical protein